MALRRKNLKAAVTALALMSVITSSIGGVSVYANTGISTIAIEREYEDSVFTIKNNIEYLKDGEVITSGHGYESLRGALSEDTKIEVKDSKIYMTIKFATPEVDQYNLISNIAITVDGKTTEFEKVDSREYTVEIGSLDSSIQLNYNVNIPIPGMPPHSFTMNVVLLNTPELEEKNQVPAISASDLSIYVGDSFDAKSIATATDKEDGDLTSSINITSNNVDTSKAGTYSVTYEVTDSKGATTTKTITIIVLEKEIVKPSELEDGKYQIKNITTYSGNSSMGASMVRNSLKEVSYVEVKDGSVNVTLEFEADLYQYMKEIKISVDGTSTDTTVDNGKVTLKVESINSKIDISAYITAMGMNINYSVGLEESTLEKIESSSDDNGLTDDSNNSDSNGSTSGDSSSNNSSSNDSTVGGSTSNDSSSSNGSTSEESSSSTTETIAKQGKLYSIKNNVTHESETGMAMARMYLKESSSVEEIDGKYYITLTFTGAEFMQNHEVYVNGSKASSTKSTSGNEINIRFQVSSLDESIKVKMYVVPMAREVEFGVELLKDTLTFVKDFTVELPQTGSPIGTATVAGLGLMLMGSGVGVIKKKRK